MAKSFKFKSDEELVGKATEIFEKLGLTLDSAVSIFLKQTITKNGLPFKLTLDNVDDNEKESDTTDDNSQLSIEEQLVQAQKRYEALFQKAMSEKQIEMNSNLTEKINSLKCKLVENFNKTKSEAESNSISDEAKENLRAKLDEIKSRIAEVQKIEDEKAAEVAAVSEEAKANLKSRLDEIKNRFAETQQVESNNAKEVTAKLNSRLDEIRNRLAESMKAETEKAEKAVAESKEASKKLKIRIDALKSRISDATSDEKEKKENEEARKIAERVKQNEELTRQARVEEGISEDYMMADKSHSDEEVPTVSAIVNEKINELDKIEKTPKSELKQEQIEIDSPKQEEGKEPVAHEEDEDETAPDSMFDAWDGEEEIGCGC